MNQKKVGLRALLVLLLCQMMLFAGCAGTVEKQDATGIAVDKNGVITGTIVETFEKDYYSVEGLEAMVNEEIAEIGNDGITLQTVELIENGEADGKNVRLIMEYNGYEAYKAFNGKDVFFGTVEEAQNAGYVFLCDFVNDKGEAVNVDKVSLMDLKASKVLILEEEILVSLPGKVLYMTAGTELIDNKNIQARNGAELTYVIMK